MQFLKCHWIWHVLLHGCITCKILYSMHMHKLEDYLFYLLTDVQDMSCVVWPKICCTCVQTQHISSEDTSRVVISHWTRPGVFITNIFPSVVHLGDYHVTRSRALTANPMHKFKQYNSDCDTKMIYIRTHGVGVSVHNHTWQLCILLHWLNIKIILLWYNNISLIGYI